MPDFLPSNHNILIIYYGQTCSQLGTLTNMKLIDKYLSLSENNILKNIFKATDQTIIGPGHLAANKSVQFNTEEI
jgi:hypothetical protein